ncbi:MAG: transcriptional repressor [Leptospiraceae bacterium]|nr:transcriptional repressor [Leptospiraceae bacterium]
MADLLLSGKMHLTAEDINQLMNESFPSVSRATVFNNLNLFVEKGLLRKLEFKPGMAIYDTNFELHHHFIDNASGKIIDVELNTEEEAYLLEAIEKDLQKKEANLTIKSVDIIIRGQLKNPEE